MQLSHADPRNLTLSPLNMHYGEPDPDISDIVPSVRQKGVLQTLLVRQTIKQFQRLTRIFSCSSIYCFSWRSVKWNVA